MDYQVPYQVPLPSNLAKATIVNINSILLSVGSLGYDIYYQK